MQVSFDHNIAKEETYVGAEFLEREALDGVDAELGVGLDNGETTGHYSIMVSEFILIDKRPDLRHVSGARIGRTEVLLGGAVLLENLNETGLQLLNGGNVVGKDTHLTGGGGEVDLGTVIAKVGQYL
jgi:hypothetical protein